MPRWMICCSLFAMTLMAPGCLPPVQEATDGDTPNVSAAKAEQNVAADNAAATSTNLDTTMPSDAAPDDFSSTASGLKYKIVREGGRKPKASDQVRVHYKGWLNDGTIFDQSYGGDPAEFPLNEVIAGWTEGLQLVGEGGEIELEIPGPLAYPGGRPGIPPGATLHFKVELLKVL